MPATTSGFWPEGIRPKMQTPSAILRTIAKELADITKGTLIASASSVRDSANGQIYHSLDVTVPALNHFRQRLLTVRHSLVMVYPTYVDASCFDGNATIMTELKEMKKSSAFEGSAGKFEIMASTDDEFRVVIRLALRSDSTKSKLASLIAMANEETEVSDHASSGIAFDDEESEEFERQFPQQERGMEGED